MNAQHYFTVVCRFGWPTWVQQRERVSELKWMCLRWDFFSQINKKKWYSRYRHMCGRSARASDVTDSAHNSLIDSVHNEFILHDTFYATYDIPHVQFSDPSVVATPRKDWFWRCRIMRLRRICPLPSWAVALLWLFTTSKFIQTIFN